MNIRVHYLAQLRAVVGSASESIDLPAAAALPDLVGRLVERHGDAFRRIVLDETGQVHKSMLLFVNDEQVAGPHPLREGDAVTLLAPMAGG